MILRKADVNEFDAIRAFYWEVIDLMPDAKVGWIKGVYPSDGFIAGSLENGELYVLDGEEGGYAAAVIVNSLTNEGYAGIRWMLDLKDDEVITPHALAVHPRLQGQGIGKKVVDGVVEIARLNGKRAVRLDVLAGNTPAEKLYTGKGFRFIEAKTMFYEDTGWTEFRMFECPV